MRRWYRRGAGPVLLSTSIILAIMMDGEGSLADPGTYGRATTVMSSEDAQEFKDTKVAFVKESDIFTVNGDGTGMTNLTRTSAVAEFSPSWAPNGNRIVFAARSTGEDNVDLFLMDADGSGIERLTTDLAYDLTPAWSPDGERIAFVRNLDGNNEVFVVNADGSEEHQLTNHPFGDESPAWSPDGTRLVFQRYEEGVLSVYSMKSDGTDLIRLTKDAHDAGPAWSPDGTRIAFTRALGDDSPRNDIYLMDPDGTRITRLTTDGAPKGNISWFSADMKLGFSVVEAWESTSPRYQIFVTNGDGTGRMPVTDTPLGFYPEPAIWPI